VTNLRILTVGETDDVWLETTSNVDLSAAAATVRTFAADVEPTGSWVAAQAVEHPDANTLRVALRVTNAAEGAYVAQAKIAVGGLTVIESGYYWVTQL
jgi:hypothetical protein